MARDEVIAVMVQLLEARFQRWRRPSTNHTVIIDKIRMALRELRQGKLGCVVTLVRLEEGSHFTDHPLVVIVVDFERRLLEAPSQVLRKVDVVVTVLVEGFK